MEHDHEALDMAVHALGISPMISHTKPGPTGLEAGRVPVLANFEDKDKADKEMLVGRFRALGVMSTFVAGVEAQCLGLILWPENKSGLLEVVRALLLAGLLLSLFGAALSVFLARWVEVLGAGGRMILSYQRNCERMYPRWVKEWNEKVASEKQKPKKDREDVSMLAGYKWIQEKENRLLDELVNYYIPNAQITNSTFFKIICEIVRFALDQVAPFVFYGFFLCVLGMTLYTWAARSQVTAIVCTIMTTAGFAAILLLVWVDVFIRLLD
ncbi:hypothetical protein CTheo_7030 [Ceratobasidium theobromae]|uniref:Transmembrane protein n=1 Tax=Ceratobasidium theobromae TaxID=1582974 RepID=A0A5N5QDB8_9AGAM|nr:hypothetical protein CTheo_7030 [Ceratobasidium theobromae]